MSINPATYCPTCKIINQLNNERKSTISKIISTEQAIRFYNTLFNELPNAREDIEVIRTEQILFKRDLLSHRDFLVGKLMQFGQHDIANCQRLQKLAAACTQLISPTNSA